MTLISLDVAGRENLDEWQLLCNLTIGFTALEQQPQAILLQIGIDVTIGFNNASHLVVVGDALACLVQDDSCLHRHFV